MGEPREIRICGDYKIGVNPALFTAEYALPLPTDIFNRLAGCSFFSKLDLSAAYNQVTLSDAAAELTTINTPFGLFRYRVLPFGIASAPAIFQRTMDRILEGLPRAFGYLDDIVVGGTSEADHLANLERVLQRLQEHKVLLNREKCQVGLREIEYLGHQLSVKGIKPTPEKVTAIQMAPAPKDAKTLRAFLGMINYYGRFIPNISSLLAPLYRLLKKGETWSWGEEEESSFRQAKQALSADTCLMHYSPDLPLTLTCDASQVGVGVVLAHRVEQGVERPIAFASRKLNAAERNYSQVEKEALAIMVGLKKFHHFLFGREYHLKTDHKPLLAIFGAGRGIPAHTVSRLNRWALLLAEYTFTLEHVDTNRMVADFLSRAPTQNEPPLSDVDRTINALTDEHLNQLPITCEQVAQGINADAVLSQVMDHVVNGWPDEREDAPELRQFRQVKEGLHVNRDVLMYGARVVIPKQYRRKILQELHGCHLGMVKMKALSRQHVFWPGLSQDIEGFVRDCDTCQRWGQAGAESQVQPTSWPGEPWSVLNIDLAGPIAGKMILIAADQATKWLEACIIGRPDSASIIQELRRMFATFGLPRTIVADNATYFQSAEMQDFCKKNGIRLAASSPYHPRTNGLAERNVQTVKMALAKQRDDKTSLQEALSRFLLSYRMTPQTTTGSSPAELMFGRRPRTRIDLLKPSTADKVFRQQERQLRGREPGEFAVGERVYAREFPRTRDNPKFIKATVVSQQARYTYLLRTEEGHFIFRHVDHIKHGGAAEPLQGEPQTVGQGGSSRTAAAPQGGSSRISAAPQGSSAQPGAWGRPATEDLETVAQPPQELQGSFREAELSRLRLQGPERTVHRPIVKTPFQPGQHSTPRAPPPRSVDMDELPAEPAADTHPSHSRTPYRHKLRSERRMMHPESPISLSSQSSHSAHSTHSSHSTIHSLSLAALTEPRALGRTRSHPDLNGEAHGRGLPQPASVGAAPSSEDPGPLGCTELQVHYSEHHAGTAALAADFFREAASAAFLKAAPSGVSAQQSDFLREGQIADFSVIQTPSGVNVRQSDFLREDQIADFSVKPLKVVEPGPDFLRGREPAARSFTTPLRRTAPVEAAGITRRTWYNSAYHMGAWTAGAPTFDAVGPTEATNRAVQPVRGDSPSARAASSGHGSAAATPTPPPAARVGTSGQLQPGRGNLSIASSPPFKLEGRSVVSGVTTNVNYIKRVK